MWLHPQLRQAVADRSRKSCKVNRSITAFSAVRVGWNVSDRGVMFASYEAASGVDQFRRRARHLCHRDRRHDGPRSRKTFGASAVRPAEEEGGYLCRRAWVAFRLCYTRRLFADKGLALLGDPVRYNLIAGSVKGRVPDLDAGEISSDFGGKFGSFPGWHSRPQRNTNHRFR